MLRRDQRRAAVFAVYQNDVTGNPVSELLPEDSTPFTRELAEAASLQAEDCDAVIDAHAHGWDVTRIAPLERAILRVALVEMTEPERFDSISPIAPEGAIDEAVETTKQYCGTDAPGFVNGILGAVLEERRAA